MNKSKKCAPNNLQKTICALELILADITETYSWIGGEVFEIKALTSTSYKVSISQEERADIFTYEYSAKKDGTVTLLSKTESTRSY